MTYVEPVPPQMAPQAAVAWMAQRLFLQRQMAAAASLYGTRMHFVKTDLRLAA